MTISGKGCFVYFRMYGPERPRLLAVGGPAIFQVKPATF